MARPERLVLVVGTGTEVGKTWVACQLARALRASGLTVSARKPAQSFVAGPDTEPGATDAELLAAATGESPFAVCPRHRWYEVPMAPPMAADVLGRPPIALDELVGELAWPVGPGGEPFGVGVLETAGGVRSPIADDGDAVGLAVALEPDLVLLVADGQLGVLNAVRLAAAALAGYPLLVFLNRFDGNDDLQHRNRLWLTERDRLDVVTTVAEVAARVIAPLNGASSSR